MLLAKQINYETVMCFNSLLSRRPTKFAIHKRNNLYRRLSTDEGTVGECFAHCATELSGRFRRFVLYHLVRCC